jgi:general secretion pathway protein L
MRQEAHQLRANMMQTYRKAFPQDTVVVDPLLQMRRRVTDAGRAVGNAGPDDFLSLLARFGTVWSKQNGTPPAPAIAHLSYRDHSLIVGLLPGNQATMDKLDGALRAQKLAVSSAGQDVWQIRNAP